MSGGWFKHVLKASLLRLANAGLIGGLLRRMKPSTVSVLLGLVCLAALSLETIKIMNDYVRPVFNKDFGFVADFQYFYEGAQRFLESPSLLYEGNTHDGFLLIESRGRINYGYPPPAVLLFVPFALLPMTLAYPAFILFNLLLTGVCVWQFKVLYEQESTKTTDSLITSAVTLLVLSLGSTYVTYVFGQVNVVVLFLCVLYIGVVRRQWYVLAGVLLAAGFWLKFYPLFMVILAPFEKRPIRLLCSIGAAMLLLPVVLLPLLPLELYLEYFGWIYPGLADQTAPHVYNQSIIGWVTRLALSSEDLFSWGPVLIPASAKLANGVATAGILGGLALSYWKRRSESLGHYACVLAATPMLVTYGWGGTYMLAVPLLLLSVLELLGRGGWRGGLVLLIAPAVILPAYRPFPFESFGQTTLAQVFYSRYLLLTAMGLVAFAIFWRPLRGRATSREGPV